MNNITINLTKDKINAMLGYSNARKAPNLVVTHFDNEESIRQRAEKLSEVSKVLLVLKPEIARLLEDNSVVGNQVVRCALSFIDLLARHTWIVCRFNEDQHAGRFEVSEDKDDYFYFNEEQIKIRTEELNLILGNMKELEVVTEVKKLDSCFRVSHLYTDNDEDCRIRAEKLGNVTPMLLDLKREVLKLLEGTSHPSTQGARSVINFLETLTRYALEACQWNENNSPYRNMHKDAALYDYERVILQ